MTKPNKRTMAELATTTTNTDAWIPRDVYARAVYMAMTQGRVLGNLAAAVQHRIEKGTGDSVLIRVFPKLTAQGPIAEGVALAEGAAVVPTTVRVTIEKFGDWRKLTDESIEQTSDDLKGRLFVAMGDALAEKLEQKTYDALKNATGTLTTTLDAKGIIDYQEVLKARAKLKAKHMEGDYLVIHADHEVDLLLDANLTKTVDYGASEVALPGEVGRIGPTRVLVHALAAAKDTATVSVVQGIMLHKGRAFAEAFGKPLRFHERYNETEDTYNEVAWVWYGVGVIDPEAIVLMKNAAV